MTLIRRGLWNRGFTETHSATAEIYHLVPYDSEMFSTAAKLDRVPC